MWPGYGFNVRLPHRNFVLLSSQNFGGGLVVVVVMAGLRGEVPEKRVSLFVSCHR